MYIDADISPKLARELRSRGYDALSANEAGRAEASDPEQMAFAAREGRALLTCNARDFTPIFQDYWFAGQGHSGVIVSEQLQLGEMLRRVVSFLESTGEEDMLNNWKNLVEFTA